MDITTQTDPWAPTPGTNIHLHWGGQCGSNTLVILPQLFPFFNSFKKYLALDLF